MRDDSTPETSTGVYDPQYNQWFLLDDMPGPRTSHAATRLGTGVVLVTGGYSGQSLSSVVRFTPPQ
nr:kelch repeat-containing protein [Cystobacter ferrugineus]